mmetsp:Transcript_33542/g.48661  ORF Transcript_33542/g.48661 Transcript_33542/m.48661 type:complete len:726 (+) Transcript_33542:34-2211(+)
MNDDAKAEKAIHETIKIYLRQRPSIASNDSTPISNCAGINKIVRSDEGCFCNYYSANNKINHEFKMNYIFDGDTSEQSQTDVFNIVAKPIVDSAILGYSGTIIAYGPTNSGKTYTMRGKTDSDMGIMPRCIELLLNHSGRLEIQISYLQIYCETISDLLAASDAISEDTAIGSYSHSNNNQPLVIREQKQGNGVYVEGLRRYNVSSVAELWTLLERGDAARSTASTNFNETSSRSHAALMVYIISKENNSSDGIDNSGDGVSMRESVLVLVDLAGSERAAASEGKDYMRLEEAKAINLSLSALGNCMSALAESANNSKQRSHIPYRDSKLTRLLQGSLGGSARTAVIVNVAPGEDSTGEVLNALRFASRAAQVKVAAKQAKVSVQRNYEALYVAACRTIDQLEQEQRSQSEADLLRQQLANKDLQLSQQAAELESLRSTLTLLQSSATNNHISSTASNTSKEDSSPSLSELTASHVRAVEDLRASFQKQLVVYKSESSAAARELSALQDELNAERQKHLATMQEVRSMQEKKIATETALRARIEDLLAELSEKRASIDDLTDVVQGLQGKLQQSEAQHKAAQMEMLQMVSQQKVQEMEALFLDTVSRLSTRVQLLETSQKTPTMNNNSHGGLASLNQARLVGRNSHGTTVGGGGTDGRIASNSADSNLRPLGGIGKVLEPGGRLRNVLTHNNHSSNNNSSSSSATTRGLGLGMPYSSSDSQYISD